MFCCVCLYCAETIKAAGIDSVADIAYDDAALLKLPWRSYRNDDQFASTCRGGQVNDVMTDRPPGSTSPSADRPADVTTLFNAVGRSDVIV